MFKRDSEATAIADKAPEVPSAAGPRLRDEVRDLLQVSAKLYDAGIIALSTAITANDVEWCRKLLTTNFAPAHAQVTAALALMAPKEKGNAEADR